LIHRAIQILEGSEPMLTNKAVFNTVEFETWKQRELLIPAEEFLIDHYLDLKGNTLEAGTGGGRILRALKNRGFSALSGFDFVSDLIEQARKKDLTNSLCLEVQDAASLSYADSSFDQVIYLQQIISLIEDERSRLRAIHESCRVLKPGGIALFSFLCFEARSRSWIYRPYLVYLSMLRRLRGSVSNPQYLPWLRYGGKLNHYSLFDSEPYVYWFKLAEVYNLLSAVGFEVVAVGSNCQIEQGQMAHSYEGISNECLRGMLYFVCKKRAR